MLYSHKENTVQQKNKCQGILPTFMLAYLINLKNLGAWGIYGWYSQYYMSDFPIFFSTSTWSKFPTFMLTLLFQISIIDYIYIYIMILFMISFDGRLYDPIGVY